MVRYENVIEDKNFLFITEASDIGFKAGDWPR